jgi:cyclopropane-fatty-acyl-phospholipid synthase
VTTPVDLAAAGTSRAAIASHYDLSDEFFQLWLGPDLVYSCALWAEGAGQDDAGDSLQQAQLRKLDFFARSLGVRGGRVLDVGCGWGAFLQRCVDAHGASGAVGLTLSPAQVAFASQRNVPAATFRLESWVDHEPTEPYDAVTCIESTEHFASDALTGDEKVEVYRAFFATAASWLRPGGRLGLQLICLDGVGEDGSRPGRGPLSELIRTEIFPESMPASLSEMALGWETHFQLDEFLSHSHHYRRTFRHWALALRADEQRARRLVGDEVTDRFGRYFAAGEVCFRLREHALYRVILTKRPEPKSWVVPLLPSQVRHSDADRSEQYGGATAAAVQSHYDVSNDFYRLWLGPSMMYSSGLWRAGDDAADLERAMERKVDFFAGQTVQSPDAAVLDVGCGWGWNLRRLVSQHGISRGVGLTLSEAQRDYVDADPIDGVDLRLEGWADHHPNTPYGAIFSYGAFEHFARDGSTSAERVTAYRDFFAACRDWLVPDGRVGLETIAHDDAPDTAAPKGRGPVGDFVLGIYPESIPPHLCEIVLGFEPYFELELLRADGADFARTCRLWLLRMRQHEPEAAQLVGADVVRRFRRYLAASETQFRLRSITNYRLVLRRRPALKR